MDESIIVRMSGEVNSVSSTYSPVINVNGNSEIALVQLKTSDKRFQEKTNNINISSLKNTIEFVLPRNNLKVKVVSAWYKIDRLNNAIRNIISRPENKNFGIEFNIIPIDNNLRCRIYCNKPINFRCDNSMANKLGFEEKLYNAIEHKDLYHEPVGYIFSELKDMDSIKVVCNIVKGSFDNGQHSRSIYEFFPRQSEKEEIIESPINLMYYKLKTAVIKKIKIDLVNGDNEPITGLNGEMIVILHIRPIKS